MTRKSEDNKLIWVKEQGKLGDPHEGAYLFFSKDNFKFGDNAYLDRDGKCTTKRLFCCDTCKRELIPPVGRVLSIKGNKETIQNLTILEYRLKELLERGNGKPEEVMANYPRDRIKT